jgi:hypothetical protein
MKSRKKNASKKKIKNVNCGYNNLALYFLFVKIY